MKTKFTPTYEVTRKFIGGILDGMTHTEVTSVRFDVGFVCEHPIGGSPYKITKCRPVTALTPTTQNN